MMENLPKGWSSVVIPDIGITITGNTPPKKDVKNYGIDIPFIKPPQLLDCKVSASPEMLSNYSRHCARILPQGSVLVSCIGNLGKTAISSREISFNQQINAIIPYSGIFPEFIFYQAQSSQFKKDLSDLSSATTVAIVNKGNFDKICINIPPTNEQRRIVGKIEELFSDLDNGVQSLKLAQTQLKTYRQSILKHAFEGKLTAGWREENNVQDINKKDIENIQIQKLKKLNKKQKKLRPLSSEDFSWLPNIPQSWALIRLGLISTGVSYGSGAKSQKAGNVPVLRMGNIQNMKFDWTDLVFTSNQEEIAKYLLQKGDVLFNRTNSPELVGKTAIFREEQKAIFAGYLIRVNHIDDIVDSLYITYFLSSYIAKHYGDNVKTDGVNQSNINGDKLSHYPFPICSLPEQQKIVEEIEAKFSVIDQLEKDIAENLKRCEFLRQSILKKAFSGQLVAQDPNDEPASKLLKCIKAEKATQSPTKRKKRAS